jgi:phytoene dehydrogenase-like protein
MNRYDAIVVGAGPNGLAAAITLARARLSVLLVEGRNEPGGGVRSEALTLPGFVHDTCSAIYPLALASPFFKSLELGALGLEWIEPELPLVHPLDGGEASCLYRSVELTAAGLGLDGARYGQVMTPLVEQADWLLPEVLQPLLHWPAQPVPLARFGMLALQSAQGYARRHFREPSGRALFAGLAAHSFLSLRERATAATGLILNLLAHSVGWPLPRGGAGRLSAALCQHFEALGGVVQTGRTISHLDELPKAKAILFDVAPRHLLGIARGRFPKWYDAALERFKHGAGVFKVDYALRAPIPWTHPACRRAGTVHVCGTWEEVATAEDEVSRGIHPARPFVLVAQPSRFDASRAPAGMHTAWAYCHVPGGSTFNMTERMERQIERFAPGFRDCILSRAIRTCQDLELFNPNYIGGDINGGRGNLWQMLARPILSRVPYQTPLAGVYLCSASTPPGGGVHGMCGYNAARAALRQLRIAL